MKRPEANGVRGILRRLCVESSGDRRRKRSRIPASANGCSCSRGGAERDRKFSLRAGKMDGEGSFSGTLPTPNVFLRIGALRIARGDQTPLASFEQDDYVKNGGFGERTLASLAEEFALVRAASIALFRSFSEEAWSRRGIASQKEVSVRGLAFITAGHQIHHRLILEERYFPAIPRA